MTGCGTDRKQSLAIRIDHYSAYENKNGGGMCGGALSMNLSEVIISNQNILECIFSVINLPFQ